MLSTKFGIKQKNISIFISLVKTADYLLKKMLESNTTFSLQY